MRPASQTRPSRANGASGNHYGHGWLAAVVPADAQRFRVADSRLRATLSDAGAELVDRQPHVEILPARDLRGDARLAVVSIDAPLPGDEPRLVRVLSRVAAALRVRVTAARASRVVRRRGYRAASIMTWDIGQTLHLPEAPKPRRRPVVELLPKRALVVGGARERSRSLLDAAAADAAAAAGIELTLGRPSMRAGVLVVPADRGYLRVAVGPARCQLERQLRALDVLRETAPPAAVADRVPWPLAHGKSGLADWSLERRIRGDRARLPLEDGVLEQCIEFLVALHGCAAPSEGARPLTSYAEPVADVCRREQAQALHALARRCDAELAAVPRGFAHGDFFAGNLLVDDDGRLTGVVDWDAAGANRLPLVDLLHLRLMSDRSHPDPAWGARIVRRLLPWARSGGDDRAREYCRRIGVDPAPRVLEALVVAYWLERSAYQLEVHAHRREQPAWLAGNVDLVIRALT